MVELDWSGLYCARLGRTGLDWVGQGRTGSDWAGLSGPWSISWVDSRWHCGCKIFGLRYLGKATGNLGEKEIKKKEWDEADEGEGEREREGRGREGEGWKSQVMPGPGEMN